MIIYSIIRIVDLVFWLLNLLILAEVIASWVLVAGARLPLWAYNLLQVIHSITSPLLAPIRRVLPGLGGLDLSPIIAILLLQVLQNIIHQLLLGGLF